MISLEKLWIFTPSQKLPKNVRDLGKLIVAKASKKLPKVQKIAKSGHTGAKWLPPACHVLYQNSVEVIIEAGLEVEDIEVVVGAGAEFLAFLSLFLIQLKLNCTCYR